jgi:hypothetical protein
MIRECWGSIMEETDTVGGNRYTSGDIQIGVNVRRVIWRLLEKLIYECGY